MLIISILCLIKVRKTRLPLIGEGVKLCFKANLKKC
jgi:hypothetical protein